MSTATKPQIAKSTGRPVISVDQFRRMQDAGIFEGQRVELLDGELYEVTKNPPHDAAVTVTAKAFRAILPGGYHVREEKSIALQGHWHPEPDIAVVRGDDREYFRRRPGPDDIALVAEVCEHSPQDRTVKLAGYAAAGIPVYWILDLELRQLEVYVNPIGGQYPAPKILAEADSVDLIIDGQHVGTIAVAELLP